jgi:hypothetical protein
MRNAHERPFHMRFSRAVFIKANDTHNTFRFPIWLVIR